MAVQALLEKLSELHWAQGVEWTLGSGEAAGEQFGGIAYPEGSSIWRDPERWFYGDDLEELLTFMVASVDPH